MTDKPDNNVSRLAALFGSMAALARACDVTRSLVHRWRDTDGLIPWKYNAAIRAYAVEQKWEGNAQHWRWLDSVNDCLSDATCPTCGQPVNPDRVL